ncbi:MAG: DUF481 domain-containing protein [Planctomycetota bacterium]
MLLRPAVAAAALAACGCVGAQPPFLVDDVKDETLSFPVAASTPPVPEPPVPAEPTRDWVKLTSGEWLRGALVRIRSDRLEFDSDKLGSVTVALSDVETLCTVEEQAVVTGDDRGLRGRVVLRGDDLWIEGERTVQLERDALFAALALHDGRAVDWSGEVTVGATARSGNTSQNDFSGYAELLRESARTTWRSTYNGVASRAGGVETANNHRLRSIRDVFLTRRMFVTAPSVDAYRDRLQNIDVRLVAGAAVGYQVVDDGKHRWKVGAGPAYQFTRFRAPAEGEDGSEEALAAALRSEYGWDLTDDVTLGLDYLLNVAVDDADDYNHNLVARVSVDLIGALTLDVVFVWDRVNRPNARADGTVPGADDFRTTVGLGWSF